MKCFRIVNMKSLWQNIRTMHFNSVVQDPRRRPSLHHPPRGRGSQESPLSQWEREPKESLLPEKGPKEPLFPEREPEESLLPQNVGESQGEGVFNTCKVYSVTNLKNNPRVTGLSC